MSIDRQVWFGDGIFNDTYGNHALEGSLFNPFFSPFPCSEKAIHQDRCVAS